MAPGRPASASRAPGPAIAKSNQLEAGLFPAGSRQEIARVERETAPHQRRERGRVERPRTQTVGAVTLTPS
ncbi:MAG TPA: hypothetical protein VG370_34000 [Chloroflexota bacterium]|nr:hypothetical protein [Chloroflexota bacterium]